MAEVPENTVNSSISGQSPVDRSRRFWFVSRVVMFCLGVSGLLVAGAGLGWIVMGAVLVELYVKALLSLATAVSLAYIGGSVLDYNGGFGNMFSSNNNRSGYQSGQYDGDSAPMG